MDNVLVAIALFLLVTLLKDVITRIVYMRTRFSLAYNNIIYFSQARIALLDNSFLLRWILKFQLYDGGQYSQRNHLQYNMVMLAALVTFIVEMGLIVPGLPANRQIYINSDKMVRWESEYLDTGRVIESSGQSCTIATILHGPNVKSESWGYCLSHRWCASASSKYPADKMRLSFYHPDRVKGYIIFTLFGKRHDRHSTHAVYIHLQRDRFDSATTFVRNLQRNFDLVRNVTSLTLTFLPDQSEHHLRFQVNGSQVKVLEDLVNETHLLSTGYWVCGIVGGLLTLSANIDGSQLYETEVHANVSSSWRFPMEKNENTRSGHT